MGKVNPKFIGLSQYEAAFCQELGGQHFHLVMDDGSELSLNFLDGENVQIAEKGQPYVWESYECMKGDDCTYFVHAQPVSGKGLINKSWILDLEQRLVTYVLMEEGYDPEYPRLIRAIPYFGAIKVPGEPLPTIRHHLSARMAGRHIKWHYTPGMNLQHIYYSPIAVRASSGPEQTYEEAMRSRLEKQFASDEPEVVRQAEETFARMMKRQEWYPFYEEPCFHIWISEGMNLFCFIEENMIRRSPSKSDGGGGILLLQDIDRCVDVGLSFNADEFYMVSAFGVENDIEDPLDTAESPYDWSVLTCMPSIRWEIPEE